MNLIYRNYDKNNMAKKLNKKIIETKGNYKNWMKMSTDFVYIHVINNRNDKLIKFKS